MRVFALAFAIAIGGISSAAGQSLDGFLDGMLSGCDMSADFNRFKETLADRATGKGKTYVPAAIKDSIGRAEVREKSEYYEVLVPLSGTWHGVPLKDISFSFGKENGIHAWAVGFDASKSVVTKTFASTLGRSRKILMQGDEMGAYSPESIDIRVIDGTPSYICDMSL